MNLTEAGIRHITDNDCAPHIDPATDCCSLCGVHRGEPCSRCGGRSFHNRVNGALCTLSDEYLDTHTLHHE